MKVLATILILGSLVFAAGAPKLNEVDTLKVQKAYLQAIIAQKDFETAKGIFLQTVADVKTAEKLPVTADIRISPDNTVTVTLPPVPTKK